MDAALNFPWRSRVAQANDRLIPLSGGRKEIGILQDLSSPKIRLGNLKKKQCSSRRAVLFPGSDDRESVNCPDFARRQAGNIILMATCSYRC
jgi:hypothetical protein